VQGLETLQAAAIEETVRNQSDPDTQMQLLLFKSCSDAGEFRHSALAKNEPPTQNCLAGFLYLIEHRAYTAGQNRLRDWFLQD
jgi:hypothetical protein